MSGSTPVIRGNSLYTIANGSAWNTARRSAEKLGGALVSIEDGKENKFVFDNFGYDPETGKTISSGYWIGFTDQDQEGSWKWISGADSQWMPSSFRPGVYGYEPNGNGDHAWVKSGFGLNQLGLPMRSREEIEETAPDIFLIEGPGWDDTWESGEGTNYGVAEIPFIRRGDSAYVIVEGPTWEEAEANANALGGHLVTINDAEENEWIVKTFRDANKSPYPGTIGDTDIYWNGLLLSDNSWRWSNGEPLDYTNWGYKAPWGNGDRGQFILEADKNLTEPLWSDTDGKWNDMYNDLRYGGGWHGIAEIPLAPNNKPTGTPTLTGDFKVGQTISIDASSIEDADNFEGWTPTYEYSWEVTGDNGSSWTELTSADATDGDDSYTLTSEEDGKQLRGVVSYLDGYGTNESVKSITMTLNSSSVELIQDSQGMYWVKLTNGQQIKITNQGQQVGANSYRNWEAVAASIIDEQNKVIWKHTSGKIAEWNVDDQWNKQRSIKHMPCSTGFTALEQSFQMDFDNDGEIGLAYTTVESTGDTTLLKDNCNMNWVQPTDGSLYAVKANNIHVGTDTYSGWQLVAAETIDGKNKLIWSSNGERLSEWTANQDWNRQTRQVHSAGTSGYFKLEESFQMDFNNDGVVGHSYSTVESEGTVQLYLDSAGLNWIKLEDGTYHPVSTGGVQIGNQTYQGWGIAAADIIDGENKAIWVNDAQTQIVEWTLDSSWNLQGRIKYNEGTDEFLVIEESFQTDFNNDGVIGKEQQPATPVSSTVRGNSLYTIVDGPSWTQAEANSVKLGGHLVTINDAHENNFISSNPFSSTEYELYIGLRDYDLDASNDVWRWSSEENSEYLNWAPGQPDDPFRSNTSAIRISNFNRFGNDVTALRGAWRDLPGLDEELNYQYEGVSKGLAEIRFIRRGDSAYVIVEGPTWEEAEANANALGGHLVAINDADENQWLVDNYLVPNARNYFIGATDRGSEGVWSWASNDEFKYSNWYVNEPNNADGGEDYSVISGALQDSSRIGFWNDTKGLTPELGIAEIKLAPNNTPTGTLTLNGDFKIGQTISIDASAIEDADNFEGWSPTYEYSWEVSNDNGTTWTELTSSDATDGDDSYTLTSEEVGKQLRGGVNYLDGYGTKEHVNSQAIDVDSTQRAQVKIADSILDHSSIQGFKGWQYGYYDETFLPSDFKLLENFRDGTWSLIPEWGYSNFTLLRDTGGHPNTHGGSSQWAVRRWISSTNQEVLISGRIDDTNRGGGGDGITARIFHNDVEIFSQLANHNSPQGGYSYEVLVETKEGDSIDFAIDYNNWDGDDDTLFTAEIWADNNTPTGTLTLNGDFKVGQTISIDASAIEDADNFEGWSPTYEYSWEVSNDNGTTWTELTSSDATDGDDSYTLTSEEVGKQLRGVVRYLDGYGSNETVVTRKSNQITSSQCSTAKQWLRYSHQAGEDRSSGMAKFKNNDIATTFTLTNSNGSYSVIVQRLNDAGELIWSVDLEADYAPRAGSIVIGDDDTIYVTGSTKTGPSGESGKNDSDIFAMALTGEGEKLWYQNYGIGIHEIGSQAVFDKDGNIILNGRVSEVNDAFTFIKDVPNFYGASFTGGWRGFQLKINSSTGSVQHAYTTGSYNSGGELIAINQNSNIAFLGGYTFGSVNGINTIGNGDPAGANQYLIARDETTGVVLWTRMENWIRSNLAVQETEDAVYFVDKGNLEKVHGSTGQTIWSKTLENTNYFIAPINGGGVLVARGESTGSLHIQRYDADGSKAGSQVIEHQGTLYPHTLIENGNGYLLISGSTTGSVDASKDIITLNNKTESLDGFVMQVNSEFSDFQDDCNEAIDTINLQQDQNGLYLINTGDDQQIYITREGSNISDRTYPGWTMIAATNFNDTNRTAWMHSSGSITEWILDSNWSHQTSITHGESTDEFFEMEENFQMDFDGDSVIGRSFTTIESEGDISLMKDSSGNNWVRLTDGSMDDITTGGQRVGESTYGGWHIVAAETIDNLNTVIWLDQTNNMVVWNVDASWNFQVRFPHNPGSSGFNAVETSFQMDFDGNGTIGS